MSSRAILLSRLSSFIECRNKKYCDLFQKRCANTLLKQVAVFLIPGIHRREHYINNICIVSCLQDPPSYQKSLLFPSHHFIS